MLPTPSAASSRGTYRHPLFGSTLRLGSTLNYTSANGSKTSRNPSETKGPYGLTTLYQPKAQDVSDVLVHIIFVHGLGGGSQHTWTKGSTCWPRDLLPLEPGYCNVAIHSFGYDSNFKSSNILDISDFAKSLLGNMLDNPCILHSSCPIILVGHSMGGLVLKKAYILAKQSSAYTNLGDRIQSAYFIATPHQGSDHAETLSKLFRTSPTLRPYLKDLRTNSDEVRAINEEFPLCSGELILRSFYESRPMSIPGIGKRLIVEKANAVLFYQNERSELLNGDHRTICKFDTPEDSNYKIIHNALSSTVNAITTPRTDIIHEPKEESASSLERMKHIYSHLGSFEVQENDLYTVTFERVNGTCEWLTENADFDKWAFSEGYKMFWLRGPPGSGKSFIAGYAVEQIAALSKAVCYYFFTKGDKTKSSISPFLLSMACQMAVAIPAVASLIDQVISTNASVVDAGDYRTIWRKLWLEGILRAKDASQDVVWVVDALDECHADEDLLKILVRVQDALHIKILLTSRKGHDDYDPPPSNVTRLPLNSEHTQKDITAYLDEYAPMLETDIRKIILEKSNGCFLWATLVLRRLKSTYSIRARLKAVQSEPPGMDNLYSRVIEELPDPKLSQALLMWIVCSVRPLAVEELQYALEDFREDEDSNGIRALVSLQYYDLLLIDQLDRVRVRHSSVTDFLLRHDTKHSHRSLIIDQTFAHKAIALTCLEYLNGPEMDKASRRKLRVSRFSRSPFVAYAAHYVYEHLRKIAPFDNDIVNNLVRLFQSDNGLAWIEHLARKNSLDTILQTAHVLRDAFQAQDQKNPRSEKEVILERWATDLVKLVTKFGRQLLSYPPSIFTLIPPFCPQTSAPYQQFAEGKLGLSVQGLSVPSWDERICTVAPSEDKQFQAGEVLEVKQDSLSQNTTHIIQGGRLRSIASTHGVFAVGTSKGTVSIFDDKTFLEERSIEHTAAVTLLQFATHRPLLATASHRLIRIWNTETWKCQWNVGIPKECMAIAFIDDDQIVLAALKNTRLLVLDLVNRTQLEVDWSICLARHGDRFRAKSPAMAIFQTDLDVLAMVYRGQDIVVWNYEDNTQRLYGRSQGLTDGLAEPVPYVQSLAFSHSPGSSLLVANYFIGDLFLFDINSGSIKAMNSTKNVYARLVSSPDGSTFAGAAMDGTIDLYNFETLQILYSIKSEDQGIIVLSFTADGTRLVDIRGDRRTCKIWEPPVLRQETEDLAELDNHEGHGTILDRNDGRLPVVTALAVDGTGKYHFVGKHDGTVWVYESRQGTPLRILFAHISTILKLDYNEASSCLTSVDNAGHLKIHQIGHCDPDWHSTSIFSFHTSGSIPQATLNRQGTHILVCANDEAAVYLIEGGVKLGATVECKRSLGSAWAAHPSRSDALIMVSGNTICSYSWEGLQILTNNEGIYIESDVPVKLRVEEAIPMLDGFMVALYYAAFGAALERCFLCIETSELASEASRLRPLKNCQPVLDSIKYLIGTYRGRQVFVNEDGWVCSAGAQVFQGVGKVAYHFMPPTNWLAANRETLIRVSMSGDVLFSCHHEVAVIKRGLERDYDVDDM